jgi:hypothetical protein
MKTVRKQEEKKIIKAESGKSAEEGFEQNRILLSGFPAVAAGEIRHAAPYRQNPCRGLPCRAWNAE